MTSRSPIFKAPILQQCRPGTSHIATIDHSGLAISAITTVNLLFGSKLVVPETGVIMNNEMDGSYNTIFPIYLPTLTCCI